jgi:hypothetical protein
LQLRGWVHRRFSARNQRDADSDAKLRFFVRQLVLELYPDDLDHLHAGDEL